jgi:hypothetical protein
MLEDDMGAIASDDMDEDDMAILSPLAIGAMASEEEDDISDMALSLFGGAEQAVTVTKVRARAAKASVRCIGISSDVGWRQPGAVIRDTRQGQRRLQRRFLICLNLVQSRSDWV